MRKLIFSLMFLITLSCSDNNEQNYSSFNDIKNEIVSKLNLSSIQLLGDIECDSNKWFIVKGEINKSTYQNIGIYLYPRFRNEINDTILTNRYSYPGKQYSANGELFYETRVFVGNCLDSIVNSIVWFQSELNDDGWKKSIYIVEFKTNKLKQYFLDYDKKLLKEVTDRTEQKKCWEIPGIEYYDEP